MLDPQQAQSGSLAEQAMTTVGERTRRPSAKADEGRLDQMRRPVARLWRVTCGVRITVMGLVDNELYHDDER